MGPSERHGEGGAGRAEANPSRGNWVGISFSFHRSIIPFSSIDVAGARGLFPLLRHVSRLFYDHFERKVLTRRSLRLGPERWNVDFVKPVKEMALLRLVEE